MGDGGRDGSKLNDVFDQYTTTSDHTTENICIVGKDYMMAL